MFTNNRLDFYNNKTYDEKSHASALGKGIPSFVVKGLDLNGTILDSGIFTNVGTFGQLGNDGETLDISTLTGYVANYTGFIVVKSTLSGSASTSAVELSATRIDTDERDLGSVKYFTIYQLINGVIEEDYRHSNYIKDVHFENGDTPGTFVLVINGTKSPEFNQSITSGAVTAWNGIIPNLTGNVITYITHDPSVHVPSGAGGVYTWQDYVTYFTNKRVFFTGSNSYMFAFKGDGVLEIKTDGLIYSGTIEGLINVFGFPASSYVLTNLNNVVYNAPDILVNNRSYSQGGQLSFSFPSSPNIETYTFNFMTPLEVGDDFEIALTNGNTSNPQPFKITQVNGINIVGVQDYYTSTTKTPAGMTYPGGVDFGGPLSLGYTPGLFNVCQTKMSFEEDVLYVTAKSKSFIDPLTYDPATSTIIVAGDLLATCGNLVNVTSITIEVGLGCSGTMYYIPRTGQCNPFDVVSTLSFEELLNINKINDLIEEVE